MTRNMIIWIWLPELLHPVIFPCVLHTVKEIEKWWDKKRNTEECGVNFIKAPKVVLIFRKK